MAALEHRSPDRTPLFEYVMHNPVAEALLGRPYTGDDGVFVDRVRQVSHDRGVPRLFRIAGVDAVDCRPVNDEAMDALAASASER